MTRSAVLFLLFPVLANAGTSLYVNHTVIVPAFSGQIKSGLDLSGAQIKLRMLGEYWSDGLNGRPFGYYHPETSVSSPLTLVGMSDDGIGSYGFGFEATRLRISGFFKEAQNYRVALEIDSQLRGVITLAMANFPSVPFSRQILSSEQLFVPLVEGVIVKHQHGSGWQSLELKDPCGALFQGAKSD